MKLIACLSWFRERPDWLAELVGSLATAGIDHLVAVDGPYRLYPAADPVSTTEEHDALRDACAQHGIGLTLHLPAMKYVGGEVEKRSTMFALAHAIATPREDWIAIVDGDELWTHTETLRDQLERNPHDAAELELYEQAGQRVFNTNQIRKLFRAQPSGIHLEGAHYRYVTGNGTYMWEPSRPSAQIPALQLDGIRVRHRPGERDQDRKDDRKTYYDERMFARIEA